MTDPSKRHDLDLVLPTPYDDWQIDDPIWVWSEGKEQHAMPRHFAGLDENGYVLVWRYGTTSHSTTNGGPTDTWDHASKTDPRK